MTKTKTILFMGTGDIALPAFQAMLDSDHVVVGLFTQPDRPVGRKQVLTPPAIKVIAEENNIPVWQPERLRGSDAVAEIEAMAPDLIVVMAYGQILSKRVINAPKISCINLHASLLPKYRGASCIQGAIDAGDDQTGITVMHVAPALDEGDIILQHSLDLSPEHTGGVVHDLLADLAPAALLDAVEKLFSGDAPRRVQDDAMASYVPKLMRQDGELDWSLSAEAIDRRVRAYDPWPGTSTTFTDDKGKTKRLKIFPQIEVITEDVNADAKAGEVLQLDKDGLFIACGTGAIKVTALQPEGSPRMTIQQFANGAKIVVGDVLGVLG